MPEHPENEIRQIKWILVAILACTIVIALAMVPALISILLLTTLICLGGMMLLRTSQSARLAAAELWQDVCGLWRKR
ncbi:MAG TPA: hypothetical protein VN541_15055 [Tepidisphaeraceae bacterium]|nr:hypothetical protein [Tepidisphaeraceae bacterium]